ncbi:uncharacterized protein LOC143054612 [Mytilus galloprovincialis]|uniref:uncharacterized protein LOC143054612 n=1 Tax=Mytilus galloprovincialis TaxID=29158 RepID=UPI003F7C168C
MMDNQTNNNTLDPPPAPAVPELRQRENDEDIMAMLEARVDPVQEDLPPAPAVPEVPQYSDQDDIIAVLRAQRDRKQEEKMKQKAMQFAMVGAIEKQDSEKLQQLIQDGVNIDAEIIFTRTPLTHAIELRHENIAIQLIDNGCDLSLPVDEFPYLQPIHLAAREGLPNVIKKLIENEVDPNVWDADQMSPLTIASHYGHVEVAELLILSGCNIDFRDSCYRTPLHRAVEVGSIEVISVLLKHKADIDASDIKGWTPLHLAVALDYQNIINLLVDNNCSLDYYDTNNKTPLSIACDYLSRSNVDIVRATQFSYDGRTIDFLQGRYLSLLQRPREQRELLQTVVKLINAGANVDGHEFRPITAAAYGDHSDTVYLLINASALIPQDWFLFSPDIQLGHKMTQLIDWIKAQYLLQFSLLGQCKRTIRKILAKRCNNIDIGIESFPLPPGIKLFLR